MTSSSMNPTSPVSGKVWAATGTSGGLGLAVGMLIAFVPWLQKNIPPQAIPLIPPFLASLGAFVGGWTAHHKPTPQEIIAEVTQAEVLLQTIHPVTQLAPAISFGIGETGTNVHTLTEQELRDRYRPPQPTVTSGPPPDAPQA